MNLRCIKCSQFIHRYVYQPMYLRLPNAYFAYINTSITFEWCPFGNPAEVQFLKSAIICRLIVCLIIYMYERVLTIWSKYILFNRHTQCANTCLTLNHAEIYEFERWDLALKHTSDSSFTNLSLCRQSGAKTCRKVHLRPFTTWCGVWCCEAPWTCGRTALCRHSESTTGAFA